MRIRVASTLLSPRQDCDSRRPLTLPLLMLKAALPAAAAAGEPAVLGEQVAVTLGGLAMGRAEKMAWARTYILLESAMVQQAAQQ